MDRATPKSNEAADTVVGLSFDDRFAGARLVHANLDQQTLVNIRAALGQHELPPLPSEPPPSTNGLDS
jgi:hypothetical protein